MVKYAKMGTIDDCIKANNKCISCPLRDSCDFYWIYKLWGPNSDLLGACMPQVLKDSIRNNRVLVSDTDGFCEFHLAKTRGHVTVNHICVSPKARGKGIATQFLDKLDELYDYPVKAVCIANSSAEDFWRSKGRLAGTSVSRKGTLLHIYIKDKQCFRIKKEDLF